MNDIASKSRRLKGQKPERLEKWNAGMVDKKSCIGVTVNRSVEKM